MIHYHGTPFSGDNSAAIRSLAGKHAMVSYARTDQIDIVAEVCQSFCFDNGAFTAWKTGQEFDLEGYAEFVFKWHRHPGFDWYVIPDVIDGDENQNMGMISRWRNLIADYKVFQKGVPVWHMHEPLDVLATFCHSYERVAIGSSAEYSTVGDNKWWGRIADAMGVATEDGYPRAKLHGLRMLDPTVFSHLPLASADSTNVARNIGIDSRWKGPYTPASKETRARILMERIEAHASSHRWSGKSAGIMANGELFG